MKKKKAAMLARKLEAEKQLAAKKSSTTDSDDKSSKEEDSSAVEVVDVDKSESEKQATLSPKQQLASVPETTEAKLDAPSTDVPKMTFGSSSTTLPPSTFGSMPKPPTMQSEPDCPKPTFGSSSGGFGNGAAPTFGSASTTFGGAAASKPSTGFGMATSTKPADDSESKGSGAFLNLTPPKTGNTPGKFVFGSGAPITLAAPSTTSMDAAQTLASFGQPAKFGTGFGTSSGGFGSVAKPSAFGSSPFGGGAGDASKKRPLESATDEKGEEDDSQPEAKKVHTEEEEKEEDADESSKTEAAKEA